jgi:hypothetical protein
MRTITIVVDDAGGTQVKICCDKDTNKFFTKREFDRSIRAAKLQYRLQKREYRRNQIIEASKNLGDQKDEQSSEQSRPEPRQEPRQEPVVRTGEAPRTAAGGLQAALAAKTERLRREKARRGGQGS